jgi:formate dehydrogenase subunit delta
MSPDKLIYMANQITKFFAHQSEDKAVAATTDHIVKFWDPRMRAAIIAHVAAGGESTLDPIARKAVLRLPQGSRSPTGAAAKTADAQPGRR